MPNQPPSPDAEPTVRGVSAGGRVFGRYTLVGILGRGGMGVVWRAHDETLGEEIALKFLPDALRWDPGAFDNLKAEARRARLLTHPNIVRIHDFVEDASGAAISMELVEGRNLAQLRIDREHKRFDPHDILPWLPQVCAALDYAHIEARVVHRDLKPSNLMLTPDGRLKIADFGVSRSMADSISRISMMSAGTLVYMSPQQAMGEEPSPADDIYSLGATLYELLTGKPPFHTGDIRVQLFQRKPDSIAARRSTLGPTSEPLPPAWDSTLAACLAKEAADRPASTGEIARLLSRPSKTTAVSRVGRALRARLGVRRRFVAMALATVAAFAARNLLPGGAPVRPPSPPTFPSDATRALAAWNFDGDARDASGRGFDGLVHSALPTADRFGRIDRAMQFNGLVEIVIPDAPALRWSAAQPFTAALWIRQDESNSAFDIWCNIPVTAGSLTWGIGFSAGRPTAKLSRFLVDGECRVSAVNQLAPGTWHHFAMVSDGVVLTLFIDGLAVAEKPLGPIRMATMPAKMELRFGRPMRMSNLGLDGAIDDARLWRRALRPPEIAALVDREAPPRVARTRGTYNETDNLTAAIRSEFGAEARLLDWSDIRRLHRDDVRGWADDIDLGITDSGFLQRDGQRFTADKQHYFVNRFDGVKPDYYTAHDEMGGMTLALGSWFNTRLPILVLLPASKIATEVLPAHETDQVIRRKHPFAANRTAAVLSWRAHLTPLTGRALTVQLHLANGRTVQAVCETTKEGTLALALGPSEGGGISRNIVASFGELEFTLVAKDRWIGFRAVSIVGRNPLFNEMTSVEDFRLSAVVGLEIAGGPQSGLAAATLIVE